MNIKKSLLWFCMLTKRLMHKISFVILICSIPLFVCIANNSMEGESGVLKIILCTPKDNPGAEDVIQYITSKESIILFDTSYSRDDSLNALEQKKADAVWYFAEDFDNHVEMYATGKTTRPFVTVYEREDNVPLKLSREKLFGAVYSKLSYAMFKDFVYEEFVTREQVPEEKVKSYYDDMERGSDLVEIKKMSFGKKEDKTTRNFLTSPLRGMLSVLIMLCGFAAAMYFIKDKEDGRFDWMVPYKRIVPAFAQCLSATVISAVAVMGAIFVSGINTTLWAEVLSMTLFVVSATGFCLVLCIIFSSSGKLGALIPAFIVLIMVLSPIFFNVQILRPVRLMLPTHYYLYSLYSRDYYMYFVFYIVCVYGVCFLLNFLLRKSTKA